MHPLRRYKLSICCSTLVAIACLANELSNLKFRAQNLFDGI